MIAVAVISAHGVAHGGECPPIGVDPGISNNFGALFRSGLGQTFIADGRYLKTFSVWRAGNADSGAVGLRPFIMRTDSLGAPDNAHTVAVGPVLVVRTPIDGLPDEFRWEFDPAIDLGGPGRYAVMLYQSACISFFDLLTAGGPIGDQYAGGMLFDTDRTNCVPIPFVNANPEWDLAFRVECSSDIPTQSKRKSWGRLKGIYR